MWDYSTQGTSVLWKHVCMIWMFSWCAAVGDAFLKGALPLNLPPYRLIDAATKVRKMETRKVGFNPTRAQKCMWCCHYCSNNPWRHAMIIWKSVSESSSRTELLFCSWSIWLVSHSKSELSVSVCCDVISTNRKLKVTPGSTKWLTAKSQLKQT